MEMQPPCHTIVASTKVNSVSKKFVWEIDNFAIHPQQAGEALESPKFGIVGLSGVKQKWLLKIYPRGMQIECAMPTRIVVGIRLEESIEEEVVAKATFSILNVAGVGEVKIYTDAIKYKNGGCDWTLFHFNREYILKKEHGLLPNDRLTIICQLDIFEMKTVLKSDQHEIPLQCHKLTEDMGNLLKNGNLADCVLVTSEGKEIRAHKNILACRSPVFAAMFRHGTTEVESGRIAIKDIKMDIIDQMLHYIYTGMAPSLVQNAGEMLAAANKYQLEGLKSQCEHSLAHSLGVENACELLVLAELHSAAHLKLQVMDFIKSHANEVMESAGWQTLRMEHNDLLRQLFMMVFS